MAGLSSHRLAEVLFEQANRIFVQYDEGPCPQAGLERQAVPFILVGHRNENRNKRLDNHATRLRMRCRKNLLSEPEQQNHEDKNAFSIPH